MLSKDIEMPCSDVVDNRGSKTGGSPGMYGHSGSYIPTHTHTHTRTKARAEVPACANGQKCSASPSARLNAIHAHASLQPGLISRHVMLAFNRAVTQQGLQLTMAWYVSLPLTCMILDSVPADDASINICRQRACASCRPMLRRQKIK